MTEQDPVALERADRIHRAAWRVKAAGRIDEALALFQESFELAPGCAAACEASRCLEQLARHDEALEWLLRGLSVNPRQADVALTVANRYQARGDIASALRYVHQALEANPQHGRALRMLQTLQQSE